MNTNKTKATFIRLLRDPAWKQSGAILKEKIHEKWIRKENISKKKKEASYKKQKEASDKGNTHINNLYSA